MICETAILFAATGLPRGKDAPAIKNLHPKGKVDFKYWIQMPAPRRIKNFMVERDISIIDKFNYIIRSTAENLTEP